MTCRFVTILFLNRQWTINDSLEIVFQISHRWRIVLHELLSIPILYSTILITYIDNWKSFDVRSLCVWKYKKTDYDFFFLSPQLSSSACSTRNSHTSASPADREIKFPNIYVQRFWVSTTKNIIYKYFIIENMKVNRSR